MASISGADPVFPDDGGAERAVWEACLTYLPEEATVFHGVNLQDEAREHEIDILIAWPGVGVAAIEVKGGHIELHDGAWFQGSGRHRHPIDPVRQVQDARHSLQKLLTRRGAAAASARFAHIVAFPHRYMPGDWDLIDLSRNMVIDRSDLDHGFAVADRIRSAIDDHGQGYGQLTDDGSAQLRHNLAGSLPSMTQNLAIAAQHEDRLDQMTRDQSQILNMLKNMTRFSVVGGAGSGKTWLALEQTRRLIDDGKRVALLCYSRGLARYFHRSVDTWPASKRPAYTGLFHELPRQWGADPGDEDDSHYWEHELPLALGELAAERSPEELFDAVVVDEAQDFGDLWWTSLLTCLRDSHNGGLYVFSDDAQRVFARDGQVPLDLPEISLDENVRSTKQIAQVFGALAPGTVTPRGMTGPPVRIIDTDTDDAVSAADDAVDALLNEDWQPGDIALLTTGRRHPEQVSEIDFGGYAEYWDHFFAQEDVFYGHILGFKGLERPVIVLAINGIRDTQRAREILYTGFSRARTLLVIAGDRSWIEDIGGEAIRRRFAKAQRDARAG